MAEPDPDEVKHEIEMGAEEFLGHARTGNAEERGQALQERITYLTASLNRIEARDHLGNFSDSQRDLLIRKLTEDLTKAKQLLADFQSACSPFPSLFI